MNFTDEVSAVTSGDVKRRSYSPATLENCLSGFLNTYYTTQQSYRGIFLEN